MNILRAIGLLNASVLLGAVFGCLAAAGMASTLMDLLLPILVGGAIGCVVSPVVIWGLWIGDTRRALILVSVPTALVTLAAGFVFTFSGLVVTVALSVTTFGAACIWHGVWARRCWRAHQRRSEGRCPKCDYSLAGLASNARCPECGFSDPYRLRPTSCRKCGGSLALGPCCPECGTAN